MTSKERRYAGLAVLLGTAVWSTLVYAEPPIQAGNVVALKGRSTVTRAATPQPQEIPLRFRDDLFHEDRIRTMQLSLVKYLLATKGVVTVGENSVAIVRLPPGGGPTIVDLKSGKVALTVAPDSRGVEVKVGGTSITAGGDATLASRIGVSTDELSGTATFINLSGSPPMIIKTPGGETLKVPPGQGLSTIGNTVVNQFSFSLGQEKAFLENFKTSPPHSMIDKGFETGLISQQLNTAVTLASVAAVLTSTAASAANTIKAPYNPQLNQTPSTTSLPSQGAVTITGTTVTPADAFPHTITGVDILASGATVKTFNGTTSSQATAPVVQISQDARVLGLQDVLRLNPSASLNVVSPLVSSDSSRLSLTGSILAASNAQINSTSANPMLNFNSTTVTARSFATLDQALLQATAPLLNLMGGSAATLTFSGTTTVAFPANGLNLTNSSLNARLNASSDAVIQLDSGALNVLQGVLLAMNASKLHIDNGTLVSLANNSTLATRDLISLTNGSSINLQNGALIRVSGGSTLDISGGLVSFGNAGNNSLAITNSGLQLENISFGSGVNLPIALVNGAAKADIQVRSGLPFVNIGGTTGQMNTVTITPGSAVIIVDGPGNKVLLGPVSSLSTAAAVVK
jgi:hypothetical protein